MPDVRARIVHISDLHFGGDIDKKLLDEFKKIIEPIRPHFLVVSGDIAENPSPRALKRACKYLGEIISDCSIPTERTMIIPGNHDYKIKGNVGLSRLTRIPYEIYFRENGLTVSALRRWGKYAKLGLWAFLAFWKVLNDDLEMRYDEQSGIAIFGFNSTPLFEMFATGKVAEDQITKLSHELIDKVGPSHFTHFSIIDWTKFIGDIRRANDSNNSGTYKYLYQTINEKCRSIIDKYDPLQTFDMQNKTTIIEGLNEILKKEDFFDERFLGNIRLNPEIEDLPEKLKGKRITHNQLERLNRLFLETLFPKDIAKAQEWEKILKIAVVHHHPMPIPYVSTEFKERVKASFTVFYNAGTFLREIGRSGIELVLHGHKHFVGFTRVSYDLRQGDRCDIAVIGAGSLAHRDRTDPLGNEFNLITVFDDDTAALEQWRFAGGVPKKDTSQSFKLIGLEDVKKRRRKFANRKHAMTINLIERTMKVTRKGYSESEHLCRNCRVIDNDGLNEYDFPLTAPAPAYIRDPKIPGSLRNSPKFLKMVIDPAYSHLRHLEVRLAFGETITPSDGQFNLGFSFRLINGHSLSHKEFQRKYAGLDLDYEYASVDCEKQCEAYKLKVEFPEDFDMRDLEDYGAEVVYLPCPNVDPEMSNFKRHDQETNRIKENLIRRKRNLQLEIVSPVPDFIYRIRWKYRKDQESSNRRSRVREAIIKYTVQRLIETAKQSALSGASSTYAEIEELLCVFLEDFESMYEPIDPGEKLDISLAVFDEGCNALRFVATNRNNIADLFNEKFGPGEGCAGFSFEHGRVLFYDRTHDKIGYYITPDELKKEQGSTALIQYEVLVSIPWIERPGFAIGVISIGSHSKNSKLLSLFDMNDSEKSKEKTRLIDLTNAFGELLYAKICK